MSFNSLDFLNVGVWQPQVDVLKESVGERDGVRAVEQLLRHDEAWVLPGVAEVHLDNYFLWESLGQALYEYLYRPWLGWLRLFSFASRFCDRLPSMD